MSAGFRGNVENVFSTSTNGTVPGQPPFLTDAEERGAKASSKEAVDEAAAAFKQAIKIDPKNEDAVDELQRLEDDNEL